MVELEIREKKLKKHLIKITFKQALGDKKNSKSQTTSRNQM